MVVFTSFLFKRGSEKKRKKKKRRKSKSKSKSPKSDHDPSSKGSRRNNVQEHEYEEEPLEQIYNANEDCLNKKDEEARLIIQLKTKRCTTSKNVFADLQPLTEESFVSEDDPGTNKITISSIEDIPTIGCNSSNSDPVTSSQQQQNQPPRQQHNKNGEACFLNFVKSGSRR